MAAAADPFVLAAEHLAWAIREGMSFADVLWSIGEPAYGTETGNDVLWALAKAVEYMNDEQQHRRRMAHRQPALTAPQQRRLRVLQEGPEPPAPRPFQADDFGPRRKAA